MEMVKWWMVKDARDKFKNMVKYYFYSKVKYDQLDKKSKILIVKKEMVKGF